MSSDTKLVDTIIRVLGRDDRLRQAYLRRRWQGMAETGRQRMLGNRCASLPAGEGQLKDGCELPIR